MPDNYLERDFYIRGLQIRVKHWHVDAPHKFIALHGWLDNAASFDTLAPLLPNCSIVACDFPGQGYSQKRPPSATYHLWDDLIDILQIADALDWQTFAVLGHSRGAMLAIMLAASFPERIQQLILLDGLLPLPVRVEDAPIQLRHFIDDYSSSSSIRFFATQNEAVALRAKVGGFPFYIAELFAERQLRHSEQGWYWDVDERLKSASAMKLTADHNLAFLAAISCHVLIILAEQGLGANSDMKNAQANYPQFIWHKLSGHHHLHMDMQAAEVALLCLEQLR